MTDAIKQESYSLGRWKCPLNECADPTPHKHGHAWLVEQLNASRPSPESERVRELREAAQRAHDRIEAQMAFSKTIERGDRDVLNDILNELTDAFCDEALSTSPAPEKAKCLPREMRKPCSNCGSPDHCEESGWVCPSRQDTNKPSRAQEE